MSSNASLQAINALLVNQFPQLSEADRQNYAHNLYQEYEKQLPEQDRLIEKSLNEKDTFYAIHDDDLKLIDETAAIAAALWAMTSNPIAVIGKLVVLLYRYRCKRAKLTGEQGMVLLSLEKAPPIGLTEAELLREINKVYLPQLTLDDLNSLLEGLKSVTLANGNRSAFVTEDDGRWSAIDV